MCVCSSLTDLRESGHCSQDSMREDSFVSSTGLDQFSETAVCVSPSDCEMQDAATPPQDPVDRLQYSAPSDSEPPLLPSSDDDLQSLPEVCGGSSESGPLCEPAEAQPEAEPVQKDKRAESTETSGRESPVHLGPRRSTSVLSRKLSSDSLSVRVDSLNLRLFTPGTQNFSCPLLFAALAFLDLRGRHLQASPGGGAGHRGRVPLCSCCEGPGLSAASQRGSPQTDRYHLRVLSVILTGGV